MSEDETKVTAIAIETAKLEEGDTYATAVAITVDTGDAIHMQLDHKEEMPTGAEMVALLFQGAGSLSRYLQEDDGVMIREAGFLKDLELAKRGAVRCANKPINEMTREELMVAIVNMKRERDEVKLFVGKGVN